MSNKFCIYCRATLKPPGRFCIQCGNAQVSGTLLEEATRTQLGHTAPPAARTATSTMTHAGIDEGVTAGPGETIVQDGFAFEVGDQNQREKTVVGFDVSGSMAYKIARSYRKIYCARDSAEVHIDLKYHQDPQDEIAIVAFNANAWTVARMQPLQQGRETLVKHLRNLRSGGGTDLAKPLVAADRLLGDEQPGVVNRVLLLTDGHGANPLSIGRKLKARGVIIDVIGIGPDPSSVKEDLLKQLASVVGGQIRYQFVDDPEKLKQHYTLLANKTSVE